MANFFRYILLFLILGSNAMAQDITYEGYFRSDSVKAGMPLEYVLNIKYPKNYDVLLPDTTHNFGDFILTGRDFNPTVSDSIYSYDSVVYELTSFSIENIQTLSVPIKYFAERDSGVIKTENDTLYFVEYIPVVSDTLKVKENTAFQPLKELVNYPIITLIAVLVVVIIITLIIVLARPIRIAIKRWLLKRKYNKLKSKFLKTEFSDKHEASKKLAVWKSMLGVSTDLPVPAFTTDEIIKFSETSKVENELRSIDRYIYSNKKQDSNLNNDFLTLAELSDQILEQKLQRLGNERRR
ncbi:hypothetical protein OO013_03045 [Mangrovivirga sp. M17]|uniref:Protein BatD n=1 Tax=Mangrovivirga halotolerans TaxID=2993936 RepID=A0ABT3RNT8_9BACT|nr:hypothetical protein [Mangrovivirga halotolerans]MCX2742825.1 hypothetical protein [Mangrovivirga halotolerans]